MRRLNCPFLGLLLAALVSVSCRSSGADLNARDLYDDTRSGVHLKAVVVPVGTLSRKSAELTALAFMSKESLNQFSELVIADEESELRVSTFGTIPAPESDASFDRTLQQLRSSSGKEGWPVGPIARVLGLRGSWLFSYREAGRGRTDRAGVHEKVLAGGQDPTVIGSSEGNLRLLHLGFKSRVDSHFLDVAAFFRASGHLSCEVCRQMTGEVQRLTNAHTVEVRLRNDSWFASPYFPLNFRFEPDTVPGVRTDLADRVTAPDVALFYRMPETSCNWNSGGFSCLRLGVLEHVQ